MKRYGFYCFCLLLGFTTAHAAIYKWTDASGDVHFSDKPHKGAKKVEVTEPQTYTPPNIPVKPPEPVAKKQKVNYYESVQIVQPANEETIRNPEGIVPVLAETKPPLQAGDKLQLFLDGAALGDPQVSPAFSLTGIVRGSHTLGVQIIGAGGKTLATSPTITIYMQPPRIHMIKK